MYVGTKNMEHIDERTQERKENENRPKEISYINEGNNIGTKETRNEHEKEYKRIKELTKTSENKRTNDRRIDRRNERREGHNKMKMRTEQTKGC